MSNADCGSLAECGIWRALTGFVKLGRRRKFLLDYLVCYNRPSVMNGSSHRAGTALNGLESCQKTGSDGEQNRKALRKEYE
jgi:hypothetical protein